MWKSHTFAALTRLSTTTHNLLMFNISEISLNTDSEKLSLLPNKHLWTFLSHSSYASSLCRVTRDRSLGPGQPSPASLLSPHSFDSLKPVPEVKDFVVTLEKPKILYLSVSARIRVMDPFSQKKQEYTRMMNDADSANCSKFLPPQSFT